MDISVIICSHNSREDYLRRTLEALKAQTLDKNAWEIILVDNASDADLCSSLSVSWHPQARCIREPLIGHTNARLAGMRAARADLLVFVDDDNVLCPEYLEAAVQIAAKHPFLGVFGGDLAGEFEMHPAPWAIPHLPCLAVRGVTQDSWANDYRSGVPIPLGAGLCVRRMVADAYQAGLAKDPRRAFLGRAGQHLLGGDDVDLVRTACKVGLGFGVFQKLRLTHLIPKRRVELDYLAKIVESSAASLAVLDYLDGKDVTVPRMTARRIARLAYTRLTSSAEAWKLYKANARGPYRALELIAKLSSASGPRTK
jgi:glycosyltransferase involved in cell wall biosynthesis